MQHLLRWRSFEALKKATAHKAKGRSGRYKQPLCGLPSTSNQRAQAPCKCGRTSCFNGPAQNARGWPSLSVRRPVRHSLFPADDSLPTWLHTTLILAIASPFVGFLLWYGIGALFLGHLEPLSGPDFGQYFFGDLTLHGRPARIAGLSLLLDASALVALVLRFSRLEFASTTTSAVLPWAFFALSTWLSFLVRT